ncbi:MAG: TetR/AcrR family transcriptional regulator [Burkholderiales bacterium]|nr:TetR/AcrR family transcriptional regulator [Burkholderiales bacterium]
MPPTKSQPEPIETEAPTRRQRRRQRVEDEILEGATQMFLAKGIGATTMQDIATEVDVAQGTLYNYFPNKEALTLSVVRRLINRYARELLNKGSERPNLEPLELVAYACVAIVDKGVTDPLWRALVERFDAFNDALHDEIGEFALANLHDAVRSGAISGSEAELSMQWRIGSWMIAGVIRDIVLGRLEAAAKFDVALHILLQKGVSQTEAKRIVRRIRDHLRRTAKPPVNRP